MSWNPFKRQNEAINALAAVEAEFEDYVRQSYAALHACEDRLVAANNEIRDLKASNARMADALEVRRSKDPIRDSKGRFLPKVAK